MELGGPNFVAPQDSVVIQPQRHEPTQILAMLLGAVLYGAAGAALASVAGVAYLLYLFHHVGLWVWITAGVATAFLLGFAWHVHQRVQIELWEMLGYRAATEAFAAKLLEDVDALEKALKRVSGDLARMTNERNDAYNKLDKAHNPRSVPLREVVTEVESEAIEAARVILNHAYRKLSYSRKTMVPGYMRDPMWEAVMNALMNAGMATKDNRRNAPYRIVRISDVDVALDDVKPYLENQLATMGVTPIPSHSRGRENVDITPRAGEGEEGES